MGIRDASIVHMAQMILCSGIYTGVSYAAGWLDRRIPITIGFFAYMLFAYLCAFGVYKIRRNIDEKLLNQDLAAFQARKKENRME